MVLELIFGRHFGGSFGETRNRTLPRCPKYPFWRVFAIIFNRYLQLFVIRFASIFGCFSDTLYKFAWRFLSLERDLVDDLGGVAYIV